MDNDSLTFDLIWEAEQTLPQDLHADRFVADLIRALDLELPVELSLLVTTDARMQMLNHQYRGKDYTTDVLSFPSPARPEWDEVRHLGDIVISCDQALRQATELSQPLEVELRFLILHGVLHLLGYDHETDNGEMMEYQTDLKQQLSHYFAIRR